jgi:hypothetical protein
MAINRYDTPAQAQFINTYVPIPFEDILKAGEAKQGMYNKNRTGFETAQVQAEQLKYIPGSKDEQYIKDIVLPTFENIADKYSTQDYSDPNIVRRINKEIQTNIDRERVRRIQESHKGYEQFNKELGVLGSKGALAPYLNQFDPSSFDSQYDIFNRRAEAALDFNKEAESYFNQLRDTHLGYNQETGMMVSGVTPKTVEDVTRANLNEFMSSPTGQQAILAMKYQGDPRDDAQIAYDVLKSRGMEFVRKNIGFAPGSGSSDKRNTQISTPMDFNIRTQPVEFINTDRKDLRKQVKDYENKRKDLENQLSMAEKYGQVNLSDNIKNAIQELDNEYGDKLYWNDEIENRVQNKFNKELDSLTVNFKNDISKFIDDSSAANKWTLAYNNALKNKGIKAVNLTSNINEEYINLFGQDKDYTKWDEASGYKLGKLSLAINKATRRASTIKNKIEDLEEQEWNSLKSNGIVENTLVLPIVETATDYNNYPDWRSLSTLLKNTPEDFKIDIVSSDDVSSKDRSNYIKDLKNAKSLDLISASPGDTESPFVYASASFENKKGELEKSNVGYKIRLQTPSQAMAIGQSFISKGNIYEGLKWIDPNISINIEKAFKNNIKPDVVGVNILSEDVLFKKINDKYYLIDNSGSLVDEVPLGKEDIKRYAYTIFGKNSGIINQ